MLYLFEIYLFDYLLHDNEGWGACRKRVVRLRKPWGFLGLPTPVPATGFSENPYPCQG